MSLHADDLRPGQRFELPPHTLTRDEIVAYATAWDPIVIHTDPDAARERGLEDVIASGLHTLAVFQRSLVDALWSQVAGGVGRSFHIDFRRPVRPGSTIAGHATVTSVTPREGRGDATVVIDGELRDDRDRIVLAVTNTSVIPYRARGGDPAQA